MKQLSGSFHIGVEVAWLKEMIARGVFKPGDVISRSDGSHMSNHEAMLALKEWESKGLRWIPTCDNCDSNGKCQGHPRRAIRAI